MSWSQKNGHLIPGGGQSSQDVYFLGRYDELSKLVAFGQKLKYFTDQNGPTGGPHENEF